MILMATADDSQINRIGFLDVIVNMTCIYNTIMHWPIFLLNFGIVWKELQMILLDGLTSIGGPESRYALTWKHASQELWDDLWMFDPLRAVPKIFALLFKVRISDVFPIGYD
jgi:hypothetical protein